MQKSQIQYSKKGILFLLEGIIAVLKASEFDMAKATQASKPFFFSSQDREVSNPITDQGLRHVKSCSCWESRDS